MAAIAMMAAIGAWAISTDRISYVVTHGISMQPLYHAGDLVFITRADSYEVGQIAAYHSPSADIDVLHRIIGGDADAGYVLQGDNNDFIDPIKPTADELIGRAILHIPHGGTWLQPLLSPTGLGMVGFLIAGGGAGAAKSRRDIARGRRKRKVKGMSGGGGSWATAAAVFKAVSRLHPALRVLAVVTAICGVLGLALGGLGWMKPTTESVTVAGEPGESMTFSYTAEVPRSAAYDGTMAYSPDPIFRKLASLVDLHFTYRGKPGRIQVNARLSSQSGWHQTLQLSQPQQFTATTYTGKVQLDLDALERRVKAAQEAIGADLGVITLAVTAQIRHSDSTVFEPQLLLNLAPLQLALASGPESLVVDQSSRSVGASVQERQIGAFGYDVLTAAQARKYAAYLLLVGLIGAGVVAWRALGNVPLRTRVQIQRRYPHLLVPVEPMASPPGKPVVVVDTFPALVKLAEKYGQMILTWTRPDGADDFVVRDEGILYRYRILPPDSRSASGTVESSATSESGSAARPQSAAQRKARAPGSRTGAEDHDVRAGGAVEPTTDLTPATEPESGEPQATEASGEPVTAAKKAPAPRKRASKAAPAKAPATKAPAKRAGRAAPKPVAEQPPATEAAAVGEVGEQPLAEPTIEHPSAAAHAAILTAAIEAAENEGMAPAREVRPKESRSSGERLPETEGAPEPEPESAESESTKPESTEPESTEPERPARKRTGRRKPRPRKTPQVAPAVAEREAVEDLAARNVGVGGPAAPGEAAGDEDAPPSEPPQEPFYDFLPPDKRSHYRHDG